MTQHKVEDQTFKIMEMSPIWNVIFIAAFSQGLFVAIVLFIQFFKTREKSSLFLGLFVFTFSFVLLNNVVYWNSLFKEYPHFLFVTISIRYLVAPFFLFFVLAFLEGRSVKIKFYHFLPFVFLFLYYLPLILLSGDEKIALLSRDIPPDHYNSLRFLIGNYSFKLVSVQLILYAYLAFKYLGKYLKNNYSQLDKDRMNQIAWLKFLNFLFFIYGLMMLLYFILIYFGVGGIEKDYFISLAMCMAVYCISYVGMFNPELLKGKAFIENITNRKYSKTRLKESYLEEITDRLEDTMQLSQLFLNPDLKMDDVASELNLPKHHISQALSLQKGITFTEFVNIYRIKYAKGLLDDYATDQTIKTVMYSSGFNNRASFNNNFKRLIGMTASEYLKASRQ